MELASASTRGPDEPSADECRAAVKNILKVYGTPAEIPPSMVSTCVEHASAQSVACMQKARTDEDIANCQ